MVDTLNQAYLLTALLSYVAGSIPFGLVLTKLAGTGNLREIGSGNIGATNVLRTGRKGIAAATLLLDAAKGAAAVLVANKISPEAALIAGLFAVLGHNFPVWLKFKGGKGMATTLGVLLAIAWQVGLLAIATWLLTAAIFRFSSLAALIALLASPIFAYLLSAEKVLIITAILALLGIARHHENIRRLIAGEESKIRFVNNDTV
ncbi:MAG: acyl-phosphate glycerol 3-phosphate acyltransferase [Rhodospirillaceae bacterium TMED167]|nr:MAG: acyl-phosphate glycerol 3-phosphate acyltransferase [Rhodospirillaceae bacterium TMED167]